MLRTAKARDQGSLNPDRRGRSVDSFTDLFVGILFLFLIMIAALMIMQRTSVQTARNEAARDARAAALTEAMDQVSAQLDALKVKNSQMAKNAAAHDAREAALVEAVNQAKAQVDALNSKNKELQSKLNSTPSEQTPQAAGQRRQRGVN